MPIVKFNQYLVSLLLTLAVTVYSPAETLRQQDTSAESGGETVVLLHGLGRNKTAMWLLARRIENAGFDVVRIGYDSLHATPEQILIGT